MRLTVTVWLSVENETGAGDRAVAKMRLVAEAVAPREPANPPKQSLRPSHAGRRSRRLASIRRNARAVVLGSSPRSRRAESHDDDPRRDPDLSAKATTTASLVNVVAIDGGLTSHRRPSSLPCTCGAVRLRCVNPSLIVVGGFLQIVGYAITALDLRQTRRRLRAGLVPFPGYQAVDFFRTSDTASVRPPTLDERLTAVEREVGAIAHRLQTSADEAVAQRLRDEAAAALGSQRPWRDFLAREPLELGEPRAVHRRRDRQRPGRTRIAATLDGQFVRPPRRRYDYASPRRRVAGGAMGAPPARTHRQRGRAWQRDRTACDRCGEDPEALRP